MCKAQPLEWLLQIYFKIAPLMSFFTTPCNQERWPRVSHLQQGMDFEARGSESWGINWHSILSTEESMYQIVSGMNNSYLQLLSS